MGPFLISSVNIALPDILPAFSIDVVLLSWIATVYVLSIAAVLVPAGKIADHWGRTRIFALGLGILSIASIGSAMAPDPFRTEDNRPEPKGSRKNAIAALTPSE